MKPLPLTGILALVGWHLARLWRTGPRRVPESPARTPDRNAPAITFLVPAWKAALDIPQFMEAFGGLSHPHRQLVLCAGGDDQSYEIAGEYATANVVVLRQEPGEGKQQALHRSMPYATGDLIYLTDIDCRPNDDTVNNLTDYLLRGDADAVTGSSRPLDAQLSNPLVQTHWAVEQALALTSPTVSPHLLGRNAVLTRDAVLATGSFALSAPSGTDYTLAKELVRVNRRVLFVPRHPMPSEYPESLRVYVHKQARWIRNVFLLGRRYRAGDEVRNVTITMSLPYILLAGLGAAGMARSGTIALFPGAVIIHAILNRVRYRKLAGFPPGIMASGWHFLADMLAALQASADSLRGSSRW